MSGPNFILDKGYKVDAAATNVAYGRFAKFLAADATGKTITTATVPAGGAVPAPADFAIGVYQDTVDAAKVATGKHVINTRILGISRVVAGGAVVIGDRIQPDAQGRGTALAAAGITAGQSEWVAGIALSPAAAAGDHFDCLLTPGAVATNGGT
jgi:hypothetical protein